MLGFHEERGIKKGEEGISNELPNTLLTILRRVIEKQSEDSHLRGSIHGLYKCQTNMLLRRQ
jgi:hypothetical protein